MNPDVNQFRLRYAADALHNAGVVCHPTEAVWGLAALPDDPSAVAKILRIKNRPWQKGLVVVTDRVDRIEQLLDGLPGSCREAVLTSWPGPATWVLPDRGLFPSWVRGTHQSVAVRVSDHPLTVQLCAAADSCLVSTSANPAGREPARDQVQAQRYFGAKVDYYLPGRTGALAQPTQIRDALSGEILRPG